MRISQRILTVIPFVLLGGCANSAVVESEYDEVARIIGAGLNGADRSGELGAFADSAMLARDQLPAGFTREWGLISGKRGDFEHRYVVVCVDGSGFAVDPCGPTTERARVLASWTGPYETATHEGILRRGGYWTIAHPSSPTAMIAGDTWFEYDAGAYRIEDYRDLLLVVDMDRAAVTHGGMNATITLEDGTAEPREIHGDIALEPWTATITLDGVHTTEVDMSPILIR